MLKILDVFCGCGGASLGFKHAFEGGDWHPGKGDKECEIIGLDLARDALSTYQWNHVGQAVRCDARSSPIKEDVYFDYIIACPPCPAFSQAVTKKTKRHRTQEKLVLTAAEFIATHLPRAFMFENVPGIMQRADLMSKFFGILSIRFDAPEWERIRRAALNPRNRAKTGWEARASRPMRGPLYNVSWGILDACNYGVPQRRKRLIVMGLRAIPEYSYLGEWIENPHIAGPEEVIAVVV